MARTITSKRISVFCALIVAASVTLWMTGKRDGPVTTQLVANPDSAPRTTYSRIPVSFTPNLGQSAPQVRYLSQGSGYQLFLTSSDAILRLLPSSPGIPPLRDNGLGRERFPEKGGKTGDAVLRIRPHGGNPHPRIMAQGKLRGKNHYLIGNNPARWHTDIPLYGRVQYAGIYPGIDLDYHGNGQSLEYDFVVAPGAEPDRIVLEFSGAEKARITQSGELELFVGNRVLVQTPPRIYQKRGKAHETIAGSYVMRGRRRVGFQIAAYDRDRPLIIDPVLVFSTYLGGMGDDRGFGIISDATGNAYITGVTASPDFPVTAGALDSACGTGPMGDCDIRNIPETGATETRYDAFVTKLDNTGTLVYSTFLGGSGFEAGRAIAVDPSGNAYLTGGTTSPDFPVTAGAFDTTPCPDLTTGGDKDQKLPDGLCDGGSEAFVTKLNAAGSALVYSTYLGGGTDDTAFGIALDSQRNAYVTGSTRSSDFPTATPLQATLGGNKDAFVTKLNAAGTGLLYSTYLGGTGEDTGHGIAVDGQANAYITGYTGSPQPTPFPVFPAPNTAFHSDPFPTTAGALDGKCGIRGFCDGVLDSDGDGIGELFGYDAFVTKVNAAGDTLLYSTFLGGSGYDFGNAIAIDGTGNAFVTGITRSPDFPMVTPFQAALGGSSDAFVSKLNPAGTALLYSTFLGGSVADSGEGIALDSAAGTAYVTGYTLSPDFPSTQPIQLPPPTDPAHPDTLVITRAADAFAVKLTADGAGLAYATYFGGQGSDYGTAIALDTSGPFNTVYLTGYTVSPDLPVTGTAVQARHGDADDNGAVTANDAFVARISDQAGDLAVLVKDDRDPLPAADKITYTVIVTNRGTLAAEGVVVTDTLPLGVDFVSASPDQGSCIESGGTVSCALGSLAGGATASMEILAAPRGAGTFKNSVRVSAHLSESDKTNNSDTEDTTVGIAAAGFTAYVEPNPPGGGGASGMVMLFMGMMGLLLRLRGGTTVAALWIQQSDLPHDTRAHDG